MSDRTYEQDFEATLNVIQAHLDAHEETIITDEELFRAMEEQVSEFRKKWAFRYCEELHKVACAPGMTYLQRMENAMENDQND